jgi:hypothetical protein
LVHLSKKGEVLAFSRQVLPPGTLIEGEIKNQKLFSEALSSLLKNAGFPSFHQIKGRLL